eukprot:TRINITY_DN67337_c0_g1_i1.p1 TRINITY_DN67337_c0_g1~~TRINITY_DN67337_c0_g1_i1.p1  ORF type:complete len:247 (-),score=28.86 TRINITY_DN67337_c0_g1_i1:69-809(-)
MSGFEQLSRKERQRISDTLVHLFKTLDVNGDGLVTAFELQKLFQRVKGFDRWSDADFGRLFANADWNSDGRLSYEEFVDWILGIDIPQLYTSNFKRYPVYRAREISYPNGVTISVEEVQNDIQEYVDQLVREKHPPIAARLRKFMTCKTYNKTLHSYFIDADDSGNGTLGWNNKEIFSFCMYCFERLGLPRTGGDTMFYNLYHKFDTDDSESLSERECLCMMDSIFRALARSQRASDPDSSSDEDM